MVEQIHSPLDRVFQALSDQTRRAMLVQLASGQRTISELAAPFDMSLAAASKHVKSLERAGLVKRTIAGRSHICQLNAEPLAEAQAFLRFYEQFLALRLDALTDLFSENSSKPEET